ncbi:MAG: hypothetical protein ACRYG8_53745 [Janthinobacterium lividum]
MGRQGRVIERTFAWINRNRWLVTRYERRRDIYHAVTALSYSLICFNKLEGRFRKTFLNQSVAGNLGVVRSK